MVGSPPTDGRRQPLAGARTGLLVAGALVSVFVLCVACVTCIVAARWMQTRGLSSADYDSEFSTDDSSWVPARIPLESRMILGVSLPATARDVHYAHSAGIDVCGVLRADVTDAEFHAVVATIGLSPWSSTRAFTDDTMWLGFGGYPGTPTPAWWSPPMTIDPSVYVDQRGSVWRMARYDGRTMWYAIISH